MFNEQKNTPLKLWRDDWYFKNTSIATIKTGEHIKQWGRVMSD